MAIAKDTKLVAIQQALTHNNVCHLERHDIFQERMMRCTLCMGV